MQVMKKVEKGYKRPKIRLAILEYMTGLNMAEKK